MLSDEDFEKFKQSSQAIIQNLQNALAVNEASIQDLRDELTAKDGSGGVSRDEFAALVDSRAQAWSDKLECAQNHIQASVQDWQGALAAKADARLQELRDEPGSVHKG